MKGKKLVKKLKIRAIRKDFSLFSLILLSFSSAAISHYFTRKKFDKKEEVKQKTELEINKERIQELFKDIFELYQQIVEFNKLRDGIRIEGEEKTKEDRLAEVELGRLILPFIEKHKKWIQNTIKPMEVELEDELQKWFIDNNIDFHSGNIKTLKEEKEEKEKEEKKDPIPDRRE